MTWRPYIRDRLIKEDVSGFFVIKPSGVDSPIPLSCPICDSLLRSRDDELSYIDYCCCYLCALRWAHSRKNEWKDGWRPTSEEIAQVVSERPPILVNFEID
jgi:hypothetical protein